MIRITNQPKNVVKVMILREDIVVVTLEYRSGVLGFLSDGTKYMPGGT